VHCCSCCTNTGAAIAVRLMKQQLAEPLFDSQHQALLHKALQGTSSTRGSGSGCCYSTTAVAFAAITQNACRQPLQRSPGLSAVANCSCCFLVLLLLLLLLQYCLVLLPCQFPR
jgi:hypothetical protein